MLDASTDPRPSTLPAALDLIERGFKVIPLWSVVEAGSETSAGTWVCECPKGSACPSAGKHPHHLVSNGIKDADDDLNIIHTWWAQYPTANIGISCEGYVVLDVDPRHQGDEHLAELERRYGELPPTLSADTGGEGFHLIYREPATPFKGWKRTLCSGVDLKVSGGYIVAPGSRHASGRLYRWNEHSPDTITPVPQWVFALGAKGGTTPSKVKAQPLELAPVDLGELRQRLREQVKLKRRIGITDHAELLERILNGTPLAEYGERDTILLKVLGLLQCLPPVPWEAILEILRPSLSSMDTEPEGLAHWIEEARKKYQRDLQARAVREAERSRTDAQFREAAERFKSRTGSRSEGNGSDSGGGSDLPPSIDRPEKPTIEIDDNRIGVADATVAALGALLQTSTDRRWSIYVRGGMLVRVINVLDPDDPHREHAKHINGGPKIDRVPLPSLTEHIATAASFVKERANRSGETHLVSTHPPEWLVTTVMSRGEWPGVPDLEAITEVPVLRDDGTVLETPGYDPHSRLFYAPSGRFPSVPSSPSRDEARAAAERLLDVVCDFPFEGLEHKTGWLALVLTLVARSAIRGSVPLFLLDGNVRGVGKSKLADVASLIIQGDNAPRTPETKSDEEQRKAITSILLQGPPIALFDNVSGGFGSTSIDSLLTGTTWTDRVLGASKQVQLPITTVFVASGNNVSLIGDLIRRVTHIRLQAQEERPDRRTGFKYPDLKRHILSNRPSLVTAALTVLRGYCAAGRPDQNLSAWGSYEEWSALIRGAIVWAGYTDPEAARDKLQEKDTERDQLQALLEGLYEIQEALEKPSSERCTFTVGEILKRLDERKDSRAGIGEFRYGYVRDALTELCTTPIKPGELPPAPAVGRILLRHQGRWVGNLALKKRGTNRQHAALWTVVQRGQGK